MIRKKLKRENPVRLWCQKRTDEKASIVVDDKNRMERRNKTRVLFTKERLTGIPLPDCTALCADVHAHRSGNSNNNFFRLILVTPFKMLALISKLWVFAPS